MSKCVYAVVVLICLVVSSPAQADQNIHTLTATMNDCWCDYFPTSNDWLCWANFTVAAPPPHFTINNTTTIVTEIQGEAIGQCGNIQSSLPRSVQMLFWLEASGTDFVRSIQRSLVKGYFLIPM